MLERARFLVIESGRQLEVEAAREGAEIWLSGPAPARQLSVSRHLPRRQRQS
jgi:hypothetical protein